MSTRLIIIDDESRSVEELKRQIRALKEEIIVANDQETAYRILKGQSFEIALVDLRLKSDPSDLDPDVEVGYATIRHLRAIYSQMKIIAVSAYDEKSEVSTNAMRYGASDYWSKRPNVSGESLMTKIRSLLSGGGNSVNSINTEQPSEVNMKVTAKRSVSFETMEHVWSRIKKLVKTEATILLAGETGTGKGYFASQIHSLSQRKDKPFQVVNCPQLTKDSITTELFGHKKATFTGASQDRLGMAAVAAGGTLFLDEIEALDLECQAVILRFIEEKEIKAFGSDTPKIVDVRLIVATNQDLAQMVSKGAFREDLYSRLRGFMITIPPLRDRGKAEIEQLARLFYSQFRKKNGNQRGYSDIRASKGIWNSLASYQHGWPGNVRELKQVIDATLIETSGRQITLMDFTKRIEKVPSTITIISQNSDRLLREQTFTLREQQVLDVVNRNGYATRRDIESSLGVGTTIAWSVLKCLVEKGKLKSTGSGKGMKYVPAGN